MSVGLNPLKLTAGYDLTCVAPLSLAEQTATPVMLPPLTTTTYTTSALRRAPVAPTATPVLLGTMALGVACDAEATSSAAALSRDLLTVSVMYGIPLTGMLSTFIQNNLPAGVNMPYPLPLWLDALNIFTGKLEHNLGWLRNLGPSFSKFNLPVPVLALGALWCCGLTHNTPGSFASFLLSAVLVSYLAKVSHERRVGSDLRVIKLADQRPLTATAWSRHIARGVGFLSGRVPEPDELNPHEAFAFADTEALPSSVKRTKPSRVLALRHLASITKFAGMMLEQQRLELGEPEFQRRLGRYKRLGEVQPLDVPGIRRNGTLARQWAIAGAALTKSSIHYTGLEHLENIPEGETIFFIGNHDSAMWPTFWGSFLLRPSLNNPKAFTADEPIRDFHVRPLADYKNFILELRRISTLGLGLQGLGLSYIGRGKYKDAVDWKQDIITKARHDLYPETYISGGREPSCRDEGGNVFSAPALATVVSLKQPQYFIGNKVAEAVVEIANSRRKAVRIVYRFTDGAHKVTPKVGEASEAFIEPMASGHLLKYAINKHTLKIEPSELPRKTRSIEVNLQLELISLEATQTRARVTEQLQDWLQRYRPEQAEFLMRRFQERAEKEFQARYSFINANKPDDLAAQEVMIMSAHRSVLTHELIAARLMALPIGIHRRTYQQNFFDLLAAEDNEATNLNLERLLDLISHKVKRFDYNKPDDATSVALKESMVLSQGPQIVFE